METEVLDGSLGDLIDIELKAGRRIEKTALAALGNRARRSLCTSTM